MADGKFLIGKPAGGVTTVTMTDGASNTNLVLPESGSVATTAAASEILSGLIELATTAEAQAGADDLRAITPLKLRNALNASGTAPIYACRAWVNFNGIGTVAIRASGNVSSITDNGVGDYTVNFTTAMPDVDYVPIFSIASTNGNPQPVVKSSSNVSTPTLKTSSQLRMVVQYITSAAATDATDIYIGIIR